MADSSKQDKVVSKETRKAGHKGPLSQNVFDDKIEKHGTFVGVGSAKRYNKANLSGHDLRELKHKSRMNLAEVFLNWCDLRDMRWSAPNFQGTSFIDSDLREIRIRPHRDDVQNPRDRGDLVAKPNFHEASLVRANLDGADIRQADFTGADFDGARLFNATLKDCDFTDAVNLIPSQMAGADLSGSTLPDHAKWEPILAWIENLSRDARKVSVYLLLACVFAWLMISQLTDAQLVLDNSTLTLPFINTGVKVVGFFVGMSVFLFVFFVYLLVNLQRNWEVLATLPAFFENGKPLYHRVFPWMPNGVIARYLILLHGHLPRFLLWQTILSYLMLYVIVPITMIAMWLRYFTRHDWPVSLFLSAASLTTVCLSGLLTWNAHRTLRGARRKPFNWKKSWRDKEMYMAALAVVITAIAITGTAHLCLTSHPSSHVIGRMLVSIGWSPAAILRGEVLSTRPEPWMNTEEQWQQVVGAQLANRDLRWAEASSAFLMKANLNRANLSHTVLNNANLQHADLGGAYLIGADLRNADLTGAKLYAAHLDSAYLDSARLSSADLNRASLVRAELPFAHLDSAILEFADLIGANLTGADLTNAILFEAHLDSAKITDAILDSADFRDVTLDGADLRYTDLSKVKNLTAEQVSKAITDSTTLLPDYLDLVP
jgi:uncharacterized protein YjbI with pentapeptide repeats